MLGCRSLDDSQVGSEVRLYEDRRDMARSLRFFAGTAKLLKGKLDRGALRTAGSLNVV